MMPDNRDLAADYGRLMTPCVLCGESNLDASFPADVRVCRACELSRHRTDLDHLSPETFVAKSGWRFAKTMPDAPHEYTVRDLTNPDAHQTTAMGHAEFEWFARLITDQGEPRQWESRTYTYYEFDGWEYWTMGLAPEMTTIINRRAKSDSAQTSLNEQIDEARLRQ